MKRETPARQITAHILETSAEYQPFIIDFGYRQATAVLAPADGDPTRALEALGISAGRPAMFISGGAGGMEADEIVRMSPLIDEGLARFAEDYGVAVVDGGTDSGVMKLLGDAHAERERTFPLIGVAPLRTVRFPGYRNADAVPLNGGHTHFVLTGGAQFGDESAMIVRLAHALARSPDRSVFGVIINGGEIARQETYARAVELALPAPLLVLEGSGRFGDELAQAVRGHRPHDTRINEILAHTEVRLVSAPEGPERFYAEMERLVE